MGFEIRYQKVVFGPDLIEGRYEGFEITLNDMSIGIMTDLSKLAGAEDDPDDILVMVRALGVGDPDADPPTPPGIRRWNLTEDGEPVPVTAATVGALDFRALLHVISQWQDSIDVPENLSRPSTAGGRSVVELSIPALAQDAPSVSPETLRRLASTSD